MNVYPDRRRLWPPLLVVSFPIVALLALFSFQLARPVERIAVFTDVPQSALAPGITPQLPLPASGSAALYVDGLGMVGSVRADTQRPIASVTKVMTAYVILKNHPLAKGQKGPSVTITAGDITRYRSMLAEDQSVVLVKEGESLTQYELLQGLLIASGNNFAEILASWDAGSVPAFVNKMNAEAAALGMKKTRYADPSGYSAQSMSTAEELILLVRAAMEMPVFAEIVNQPQATLPTAGLIYNTDAILGEDGIVGVKTGWTEDAGGCFVFASTWQVGNRTLKVYGAVLGQDTLAKAFEASKNLSRVAGSAVKPQKLFAAGQSVGYFSAPWGVKTQVVLAQDVEVLIWPGMTYQMWPELQEPDAPLDRDAEVGTLSIQLGDQKRLVPLKTAATLPSPGVAWRLTRMK